jgi:hypothetical protein
VFETHVLTKLSATDRGLFSRASLGCLDAVITFDLPIAGVSLELPFRVEDFIESVELLEWGKSNLGIYGWPIPGDPVLFLDVKTFALAAGSRSGSLGVMEYLREHDCPWWGSASWDRGESAWLPQPLHL